MPRFGNRQIIAPAKARLMAIDRARHRLPIGKPGRADHFRPVGLPAHM
jgi:hypothetical protein